MSEMQQTGSSGVTLSTEPLLPKVQNFGLRDIEVTFLGPNAQGQPTWVMWNAHEPYLVGLLSQGKMGYHFEQRTSTGVFLHENISLSRVQRALGG